MPRARCTECDATIVAPVHKISSVCDRCFALLHSPDPPSGYLLRQIHRNRGYEASAWLEVTGELEVLADGSAVIRVVAS